MVADRRGVPAAALAPPAGGGWTVVVGPEGGFDAAEEQLARGRPAGSRSDAYVLRAETAAIAAAAALAGRRRRGR